jgi:hypothetical protein
MDTGAEIMISQRRERSAQYHRDQFIGAFVAPMAERNIVRRVGAGELGVSVHVLVETAARLLTLGEKYHRLAVQQCNGEGYYRPLRTTPADLGYTTCPVCGDDGVPVGAIVGARCDLKDRAGSPDSEHRRKYRIKRRQCIDCRTREQIRQLLPAGWRVRFQGGPRGAVCFVAYAPEAYWHWEPTADRWRMKDARDQVVDLPEAMRAKEPRWLVVA